MVKLLYQKESYLIQGAFFAVYKHFRNTQKESVYHNALIKELIGRGLEVKREPRIEISYKGSKVGVYIPDIIVNDLIIIEVKAKPFLHQEDIRQFWYYLKCSSFNLGYLVNFGESDGVRYKRRINLPKDTRSV